MSPDTPSLVDESLDLPELPEPGAALDDVRQLAADIEARLDTLSNESSVAVDVLRRRLLTMLSRTERRAAAERRSLRAKKYVEQRGRCAHCGEQLELGRGRDVLPVEPHKPLACLPCIRSRVATPEAEA